MSDEIEERPAIRVVRNKARADRNIAWIEKLRITKGKRRGERFKLAPFQEAFIRDVYEPEDADNPGVRLVNRAIFSVGRKNGKSELGAAIVLLHLVGPESEPNNQIVSGATVHEQSRVVFEKIVEFMGLSPDLHKLLEVVDSRSRIYVKVGGLRCEGSRYTAVSAKPGAAHGKDPGLVMFDELAQAQNRKFFDALISAQGARDEPFFMIISTQNEDPNHVLSTQVDDALRVGWTKDRKPDDPPPVNPRVVCHLYAAKEGCDLMDEAEWRNANPALDDWINIERFRAEAEEAARSPTEEAQFRLYKLNQRVASEASLLTREQWAACAPAPLPDLARGIPAIRTQATFGFDKGERVYGGLDMSARRDLSALLLVSDERDDDKVYCKAWFWKPKEMFESAEKTDGQRYGLFAHQGWIIPCDDPTIDPAYVVAKIEELHNNLSIMGIAYDRDRKHMDELLRVTDSVGLTAQVGDGSGLRLEPWGQDFASMSVAVNALEAAVLGKKIVHDGNPILTNNLANAKVKLSPDGVNRKLIKLADRHRIDGAISLAMAMGYKAQSRVSEPYVSPFADPEFKLKSF